MIIICCLTDVFASIALMNEPAEGEILRVPPRDIRREHLVTAPLIFYSYAFYGTMIRYAFGLPGRGARPSHPGTPTYAHGDQLRRVFQLLPVHVESRGLRRAAAAEPAARRRAAGRRVPRFLLPVAADVCVELGRVTIRPPRAGAPLVRLDRPATGEPCAMRRPTPHLHCPSRLRLRLWLRLRLCLRLRLHP